jgi:hypothetical protein
MKTRRHPDQARPGYAVRADDTKFTPTLPAGAARRANFTFNFFYTRDDKTATKTPILPSFVRFIPNLPPYFFTVCWLLPTIN